MDPTEKIPVSIHCKIYTDTFSGEMLDQEATGKELFEFLMKDSGHCIDDNGQLVAGDCNLWYLGCNEKFGFLKYKDKIFNWSFGEASFDRVQKFISLIHRDGHFTNQQYQMLMDKIQEGRLINSMYHIKDYLICKQNQACD